MLRSHPIHHARPVHRFDGLLMLAFVASVCTIAINLAIPRMQQQLDDWRYGYPRTMHLAANVGHEDQPGQPTRFIAVNLDRQPVIVQIPGGNVDKTRILKLPRLVGVDADKVPVTLTLALINDDMKPDLVVNIDDEEFVYINAEGNFRLIGGDERARLEGE